MLPTSKTPPKDTLSDHTILVYGPSKIGKSTWCAQAEGALFLATEAGLNNLDVFQVPIGTWDDFLNACKEVAEGKHNFKTIIVDTIDNAYRMCAEYICQKFKIEHESDLGYGKGYALVNNEFYRVLNKLALLPYGLYLISHSQERELETRTGKLTRIVPTLPEKARKIVIGMVDVILFCDLELVTGADGKPAQKRVLRTKPNVNYEAGDRTGRLPEAIDLDFPKFIEAFTKSVTSPTEAVEPKAIVAGNSASTSTPSTSTAPPAVVSAKSASSSPATGTTKPAAAAAR
jgi:hypothetical protein